MQAEYIIVGAGLMGCVIARELHRAGRKVLIIERNNSIGGMLQDSRHESGIRVQNYGPNVLRCAESTEWDYLRQFTDFYSYKTDARIQVNGRTQAWPFQECYLHQRCGKAWQPNQFTAAHNFEETCLNKMPREVYAELIERFVVKQWQQHPRQLPANLAQETTLVQQGAQLPVQLKKYQGLPVKGFSKMLEKMIHGIPRLLNCDYLQHRRSFHAGRKVIFTGSIDAFFAFDNGYLQYRAHRREQEFLPNSDWYQAGAVVNNPDSNAPTIRTIEWKHFLPHNLSRPIKGTVITREIAVDTGGYKSAELAPELPLTNADNNALYKQYRKRADRINKVEICGRLGEFKTYDLEQTVSRARAVAGRLINNQRITTITPMTVRLVRPTAGRTGSSAVC